MYRWLQSLGTDSWTEGHNLPMKRRSPIRRSMLLAALVWACSPGNAAEPARHQTNIAYASVDGQILALDLHLPAGVARPPLVVYLHGGAWSSGDKTQYPEFLLA